MMLNYKPSPSDWVAGHWEECTSWLEHPYWVWSPTVPRIPDILLTMVFYVYPSKEAAINGDDLGGTGFFYFVPTDFDSSIGYRYAITNAHVIFNGVYNPVLRVNTNDGKFDIIETNQNAWMRHPDGDDVAISLVGLNADIHAFGCFTEDSVLTPEFIKDQDVGIGDDVFMLGRFRVHAGRQKNLPVGMFGNIAMMNQEPIDNPFTRLPQESFLVEMRSIPGFSGSPVVLYIPPLIPRPKQTLLKTEWHMRLMGICWGQISVPVKGYDTSNNTEIRIRMESAMTGVVPVWRVMDVVHGDEMKKIRKDTDERLKKRRAESPIDLTTYTEQKVFTKEDFEDVLKKIARPLKPDEPEKKET